MDLKTKNHLIALLVIVACATGYLFDVLFLDRHLSAFDIFMDKPSWHVEFGKVLPNNLILSDSPTAHYPFAKEFWGAAQQGYNPQYLPHILSGTPTYGQGAGIFATSPFQFFLDTPNALDWTTWLRMVLTAFFAYLLLTQLGLRPAASVLGGIAWAFNMHQIAWLMFPQHLATELWLTLLLGLNLLVLQQRRNVAAALGLVLCIVLFFSSGYTQIVLYTFVFIGVFNTLYVLIVQCDPYSERLKTWISIHALYLVTALFLLPDALWQAEEIAEGLRGAQTFRFKHTGLELSFSALGALFKDLIPNAVEVSRWLMPNYDNSYGQAPNLRGLISSNTVEAQVYFGILCLFFCIYGVLKGSFARDRLLSVFAILLFLCIGLLNGNNTLIALLNLVPFGGAGAYSRIITLLLLFAIICAAYGAQFFVADLKERRYVFAVISLLLLLVWLGAAKYTHPGQLKLREFMPWFIYLGMFLVIALAFVKYKKSSVIIPLAVALTSVELITSGYAFNTRLPSAQHFPENTVIKRLRASPGYFRTALLMNHTAYHHNIFTYYDLSTIGGYSTVASKDYLYFMRKAFGKVHVTLNGILFLFDGNLEILRLLNAKYVVSNLDIKSKLIEPVYTNEAETLFRFKEPLDRAYCASDLFVVKNAELIPQRLLAAAKKYDRPVIVGEPLLDGQKLTDSCKVSDLKVYKSKLTFNVTTQEPTLIFVPINYHHYWRGSINGKSVPVYKANYTFMGILVPAGESDLNLEFLNTKLVWAAVLFILLGLVVITVAWLKVKNPRQRAVIVAAALIIIGKSLLSVPGVMNTDIPERTVIATGTGG